MNTNIKKITIPDNEGNSLVVNLREFAKQSTVNNLSSELTDVDNRLSALNTKVNNLEGLPEIICEIVIRDDYNNSTGEDSFSVQYVDFKKGSSWISDPSLLGKDYAKASIAATLEIYLSPSSSSPYRSYNFNTIGIFLECQTPFGDQCYIISAPYPPGDVMTISTINGGSWIFSTISEFIKEQLSNSGYVNGNSLVSQMTVVTELQYEQLTPDSETLYLIPEEE